jgi:hypothetical protein
MPDVPVKPPPWRVFLSHTAELDRFPPGNSYVQRAIDAVLSAGHVPVDMRHFPNRDVLPSEIDRDRLLSADVYFGLFGLRWGSASATNPERSYTEEEYEIARELGIPRRIFLLDENSDSLGLPEGELGFADPNVHRQRAFRARVRQRVAALVSSPENLATRITNALLDLQNIYANSGRPLIGHRTDNIPVPVSEFVERTAQVDEVIGCLLAAPNRRVTSVKGSGGVGKTVLAEMVCRHPHIVAAFPGGRWKLVIGEHPELDQLARDLFHMVSGRDPPGDVSPATLLAGAFSAQPTLLLLDDVWSPYDVAKALIDALPGSVSVLVTTRGVDMPGTRSVSLHELSTLEGRQLLLGELHQTAPPSLVHAADELNGLLGGWALLIDLAARLIASDLGGDAADAIAAIGQIAAAFRADPTALDDDASRDRSFARIVDRSVRSLSERDRERFDRLSVYPPGVELPVEVLADTWASTALEARKTKETLERAGLSRGLVSPPRLALHDLIVSWLHRADHAGPPGSHPEWHRTCLCPVIDFDGTPREVTAERLVWLVHHLLAVGDWALLAEIATRRWREAMLAATGSDAELYRALEHYQDAALELTDPAERYRHFFRAVLFGSHVRAVAGNVPVDVLVVQAILGNPIAALTQAAQREEQPAEAITRILEAMPTFPADTSLVVRSADIAATIRDDLSRGEALAWIAGAVTAGDRRIRRWSLER